jgi:hypothetical protein
VPDAGTTIPPSGWSARARLCAPAATPAASGCDAGEVCAPVTALPFQTQTYCIARSGIQTCPTSYPAQRIYYQSFTDTRACSPCTCGPASGATCSGGSVNFYGAPTCSGGVTPMSVPEACGSLGGARVGIFSDAATPSGGRCVPDGGAPVGGFQGATPTTICCRQ